MKQPNRLDQLSTASLMIPVLLMVDSLHFVFARLLLPHLPGGTSAFYVLAVATFEVGIFLVVTRQVRARIFLDRWPFFLVIGLLVATSTAINYIAVGFIDPGTAALLAQTATIFALVLSIFWLRERLGSRELLGSAIAICGVIVISFQPGDYLRLGSLLILGSAFMYALHAAVVKRYGGEMNFANFFLFRVASVTGFLFVFAALRGQLVLPSGRAWLILILAGSVDVVISRILYYLALRRLQMSYHTIILTLSPVITILWSLFLFGSKPTAQGLIGGAAVILGVAIVSFVRSRLGKNELVKEPQV
jgi:drug/metabolite transporter (DMT)-like permease